MSKKVNNYEDQASNFLKKTGATISTEFLRRDKYFPGDEESRDIYEIIIIRGRRQYTFTFGQCIADVGKKPSDYCILSGLTGYCAENFEDFCSEFGYDTDSRSAEKTFKDCLDQSKNLQMIFNDEELDELSEIN